MFEAAKSRLLDRWGVWALVGLGVGVVSMMHATKAVREEQNSEDYVLGQCADAIQELERRLQSSKG